jgi:nitroreductase
MERKADYPILDLLLERRSPRAMSGEPITHDEFMTLIEAARWAPSSYNHQPWRFIYAYRDTPEWDMLFSFLVEANAVWAKRAGALLVVLSHHYFEYNNAYSRTHTFDTGAAAENFALQGFSMGLVVHGMEGFDYDRAKTELGIPDDYTVEAMFAIGLPGPASLLPEPLQARESNPTDRLKAEELIYHGSFGRR